MRGKNGLGKAVGCSSFLFSGDPPLKKGKEKTKAEKQGVFNFGLCFKTNQKGYRAASKESQAHWHANRPLVRRMRQCEWAPLIFPRIPEHQKKHDLDTSTNWSTQNDLDTSTGPFADLSGGAGRAPAAPGGHVRRRGRRPLRQRRGRGAEPDPRAVPGHGRPEIGGRPGKSAPSTLLCILLGW